MPQSVERWDLRYQRGDLPWDSPQPARPLLDWLDQLDLRRGRALEIGCGTGTNAVAMARRGLSVLAMDLAPTAIAAARCKAAAADRLPGEIRFVCGDIMKGLPPDFEPGTFDFAFDRGCFHSVVPADRPRFVQHIALALASGGFWLTLCGNADEQRAPGRQSPPRLSAADIVAAVEPWMKIHHLERIRFEQTSGALAWMCLMQRRTS